MKNLHTLCILSLIVLGLSAGCFRPDNTTIVVSVPKMAGPECATIVKNALLALEGMVFVEPDTTKREVSVTYNNEKLATYNVVYAITHAGFEADGSPAEVGALKSLPASCK